MFKNKEKIQNKLTFMLKDYQNDKSLLSNYSIDEQNFQKKF